jgi:hypothetical protein
MNSPISAQEPPEFYYCGAEVDAPQQELQLALSQRDQMQERLRWEGEIDRLPTKEFSSTDKLVWRDLYGPLAHAREQGQTDFIPLLISG